MRKEVIFKVVKDTVPDPFPPNIDWEPKGTEYEEENEGAPRFVIDQGFENVQVASEKIEVDVPAGNESTQEGTSTNGGGPEDTIIFHETSKSKILCAANITTLLQTFPGLLSPYPLDLSTIPYLKMDRSGSSPPANQEDCRPWRKKTSPFPLVQMEPVSGLYFPTSPCMSVQELQMFMQSLMDDFSVRQVWANGAGRDNKAQPGPTAAELNKGWMERSMVMYGR
ncbi:hypothetical protein HDV00_007292 [Rhizophlyctis rosea]|nr:hypothetical protein HDV00_007292 [Rhizophlyctis rosea]